MKWIPSVSLVLLAVLLAGCQGFQVDIPKVVDETVKAMDRNHDGQISSGEIRVSKNDPTFWLTIGSLILNILTGGVAASARSRSIKVEDETDEQWEEMRRGPQPVSNQ
jgi:hypothetical protein